MSRADIIHLVLIIFFISISINLNRSTIGLLKNVNRLREVEKEVKDLEDNSNKIKASIEYKKTDTFVEDFARDELNLIKPGEDILVVNVNSSPNVLGNEDTKEDSENSSGSNKNWILWKELFF